MQCYNGRNVPLRSKLNVLPLPHPLPWQKHPNDSGARKCLVSKGVHSLYGRNFSPESKANGNRIPAILVLNSLI